MSETPDRIETTQPSEAQLQEPAPARASVQPAGQPFEVAVLPLQNTTLFPETIMPLAVGRPRSVAAVESALATAEKLIACITARPNVVTDSDAKPAELYEGGTVVVIKRMERADEY